MTENTIKPILSAVDQQAKESINYHFNALVEAPSKEISPLPEAIFVHMFLPFFAGEKKLSDDPSILGKWISVSGSPTKEVQIIDSDMNPLFIVPALADTSIIDVVNENDGQPFFNIIMNYELHKNQLPIVGTNYLNRTINDRFESLTKKSTAYVENEKKWIAIFVRYGKIKDPAAVLVEDKTKIDPDEIEYD